MVLRTEKGERRKDRPESALGEGKGEKKEMRSRLPGLNRPAEGKGKGGCAAVAQGKKRVCRRLHHPGGRSEGRSRRGRTGKDGKRGEREGRCPRCLYRRWSALGGKPPRSPSVSRVTGKRKLQARRALTIHSRGVPSKKKKSLDDSSQSKKGKKGGKRKRSPCP